MLSYDFLGLGNVFLSTFICRFSRYSRQQISGGVLLLFKFGFLRRKSFMSAVFEISSLLTPLCTKLIKKNLSRHHEHRLDHHCQKCRYGISFCLVIGIK